MSEDSNVAAPEPGASAGQDPSSPDAEAVESPASRSPEAESPAANAPTPDATTPDATTPEAPALDAAAPDTPAPESRPAGRLSRMVPSWARRRPLLAGFGAGILAAAVISGVVYEVQLPSGPPRGAYASLPKQPCAIISAAELAKDLPEATGTPESIGAIGSVRQSVCKWSSAAGGEARTLTAQVLLFSSPSSVSLAQQIYHSIASDFGCHCTGVMVSTRPVSGLGDQAREAFVSTGPEANLDSSPSASFPGANLVVRSSNAVVILNLNTTATATGASLASPPSAAQLATMISMARGVLADLARPGSAPTAASAPVSPEPQYAGRRDPCRLMTAATLARYAPAATLGLAPAASSSNGQRRSNGCIWSSDNTFILLTLNTFPNAEGASQGFQVDTDGIGRSGNGVTGMQSLPDLGEAAVAVFKTQSGKDGVELLIWSGNVELDYWYTSTSGPSRPRATLLAGAIAMGRDGLTALSSPAASSFRPEPRYASPHDACTLAQASTLARYVPGATMDKLATSGGVGTPQDSGCDWTSDSVGILLSVTISADPDSATGSYQFGIQNAKNQTGSKFLGERSVRGVGEQATAIFQTTMGNTPAVDLFVRSGNATLEVDASDVGITAPPSRAGKLAADIAMARDALAALHRG